MRELLYKIEWPSIRRLHIGILCMYWDFVRALPYSAIESTQSPWDSGSRIDIYYSKPLKEYGGGLLSLIYNIPVDYQRGV